MPSANKLAHYEALRDVLTKLDVHTATLEKNVDALDTMHASTASLANTLHSILAAPANLDGGSSSPGKNTK